MWNKIFNVAHLAVSVADFAINVKNKISNTADDAIEKEFKKNIVTHINNQFRIFQKKLSQSTTVYLLWSIMGVLLLSVPLSKVLYYSGLSIMAIVFLYIMYQSFYSFWKWVSLINNFESHIRQILEKTIQKAKQKSWKAKIGFWIGGRDFKDFENLIIANIVKTLLKIVKKQKIIILIHVVAYIVALLFFREAFIHIINDTITFI